MILRFINLEGKISNIFLSWYLLGKSISLLNFKVHSNCLIQLPATHFSQECRRGSSSSLDNILRGHNTDVGLVGRQQRLWSTRNEGRISHQQRPMCIRGQLPWQSRKLKQAPSKSRMALATNNILKGIWYNACRNEENIFKEDGQKIDRSSLTYHF